MRHQPQVKFIYLFICWSEAKQAVNTFKNNSYRLKNFLDLTRKHTENIHKEKKLNNKYIIVVFKYCKHFFNVNYSLKWIVNTFVIPKEIIIFNMPNRLTSYLNFVFLFFIFHIRIIYHKVRKRVVATMEYKQQFQSVKRCFNNIQCCFL